MVVSSSSPKGKQAVMILLASVSCGARKTKPRATEQSEKFHVRRGDLSIISLAYYSQRSASQVLQEKVRSTAD